MFLLPHSPTFTILPAIGVTVLPAFRERATRSGCYRVVLALSRNAHPDPPSTHLFSSAAQPDSCQLAVPVGRQLARAHFFLTTSLPLPAIGTVGWASQTLDPPLHERPRSNCSAVSPICLNDPFSRRLALQRADVGRGCDIGLGHGFEGGDGA